MFVYVKLKPDATTVLQIDFGAGAPLPTAAGVRRVLLEDKDIYPDSARERIEGLERGLLRLAFRNSIYTLVSTPSSAQKQ